MEFDHVFGVKRGNVSELLHLSTDELLAEVAKCEVVCAVCHRTRTTHRRGDAHEAAADDAELSELFD